MGILCSSVDKEDDDPKGVTRVPTLPPKSPRRLHKMPQLRGPSIKPHGRPNWRDAIQEREFEDLEQYNEARQVIQSAEKSLSFDHKLLTRATTIENLAMELVHKIRAFDQERVEKDASSAGGHFLGNVDMINQSELMKVARRMPKGAHLHIHFNSCLPASFLIQQARNIDAMYIRSTEPLTTPQNWFNSRISFMVMTQQEATHEKGVDGNEVEVPLGDAFAIDYVPNRWMRYKDFQKKFRFYDESTGLLRGTAGAEAWLERKMLISEEEAHSSSQTSRGIWQRFNYRTQMMKGLFAYESAFRNYTRACIKDFVRDNIQYAEIRPNFMSTNSVKTDDGTRSFGNADIMKIISEELQSTMQELRENKQYFGGLKVIYCTPRSFQKEQVENALNECIELKRQHGDLLCGFDLVGHEEMGHELRHFIPEFLAFQKKCRSLELDIPFLFHCGETLQVGDKVDGNLFDALLLNAKRIGHGYAIATHPLLMNLLKERNMAIESCPISNEILGLTPNIAGHNLSILLANNVPCTINSDNATFYRSSLSHDFYQVMIGSESMSLLGWKQLAKWSLEHSCMTPSESKVITKEWSDRWMEYCQWIVDEYGERFQVGYSKLVPAKNRSLTLFGSNPLRSVFEKQRGNSYRVESFVDGHRKYRSILERGIQRQETNCTSSWSLDNPSCFEPGFEKSA